MGTINPVSSVMIQNLGIIPYADGLARQRQERERLKITPDDRGVIFLCEHSPPVITLGKSSHQENLRISADVAREHGIEIFQIERGGDVTFHGPGQLVCYPVLNLKHFKRDVHWYMRSLEGVIIDTLNHFNIDAFRIQNKTGVWCLDNNCERKIASLGVHLSRWIAIHGFSLNVQRPIDDGFSFINPCGFTPETMMWMSDMLPGASINAVSEIISGQLAQKFTPNHLK